MIDGGSLKASAAVKLFVGAFFAVVGLNFTQSMMHGMMMKSVETKMKNITSTGFDQQMSRNDAAALADPHSAEAAVHLRCTEVAVKPLRDTYHGKIPNLEKRWAIDGREDRVKRVVSYMDCSMSAPPQYLCDPSAKAHFVNALRGYFEVQDLSFKWKFVEKNMFQTLGTVTEEAMSRDGPELLNDTDPRIKAGLARLMKSAYLQKSDFAPGWFSGTGNSPRLEKLLAQIPAATAPTPCS